MTVGDRRASKDGGPDPAGLLSSFAEISLLFACAQTEAELRVALEKTAAFLSEHAPGPVAAGELGLSASGEPRLLWQSRNGGLVVDAGEPLVDWYTRASRRSGELSGSSHASWQGLLSEGRLSGDTGLRIAVFFPKGSLAMEAVAAGYGLADAASAASIRIRGAMASTLERRRLDSLLEETQSWLGLEADLLWEAGEDGIIKVRRVMNGRRDLGSLVDGRQLASLKTSDDQTFLDILRERGGVRHLEVEIDDRSSGHKLLFAAARMSEGKSCMGAFVSVDEGNAQRYTREAAAMMVQMRGARIREEQQRREAEAMLQGLRLLLAQDSTREKLGQLVSLVCECIGAESACVVQRGLDGNVRFLLPRDGKTGRSVDLALDMVAAKSDSGSAPVFDAETNDGRLLANAFGLEGRNFAVLPLPLRGDAAFLICTARGAHGFASADLAFADRLTLLLRQALLLREEQTQLAQTAKMAALGQMSASIAHELRQPLNTISLAVQNLEILLEAPEVNSVAVAAKTKRVLAQVERASEVIDRMRRFGRKSTGEQSKVLLHELIENVETIMHHVFLRAGVRLEVDVPEDLAVVGDQLQLEQVLGNLMQNAVDAISGIGAKHEREEGLICLRATVSPDEKGMAIVRVEDNGPGFRQEILDRVMEPFFTTKSAEHGTGLGLAICDTIIREGGGRIEPGNHEDGGYVALILPRDIA